MLKLDIKNIVLTTTCGLLMLVLIAFTGKKHDGRPVADLSIDVEEESEMYFIDNLEVTSLINAGNTDFVLTQDLASLDLKELESRIEQNAFVKDAQVFKDITGKLKVQVMQAKPIARIMSDSGDNMYIDEDGNLLPLNTKYTARVPIMLVKGDISFNQNLKETDLGNQLWEFFTYVQNDEFWKAQVADLILDEKNELTIIPQVTKQKIIFGSPENIESKFKNLKIFYDEILPSKGWNTYASVNIKFENQIVCK